MGKDFFNWTEKIHIALLKDPANISERDRKKIAHEILAMGIKDLKSLKSSYTVLLHHILKIKYQPKKKTRSWMITILNQRNEIADLYEDSPSLKRKITPEVWVIIYKRARMNASIETGIPLETFPEDCPWTPETCLNCLTDL